jgi:hypothetical protein
MDQECGIRYHLRPPERRPRSFSMRSSLFQIYAQRRKLFFNVERVFFLLIKCELVSDWKALFNPFYQVLELASRFFYAGSGGNGFAEFWQRKYLSESTKFLQ